MGKMPLHLAMKVSLRVARKKSQLYVLFVNVLNGLFLRV